MVTSSTRFSKSITNKLDTPIQFIKGVGPKLSAVFRARGIETVRDILFFFPRAYEDRTRLKKIVELREGEPATLQVSILNLRKIPLRTRSQSIVELRAQDESGMISLKWFYFPKGLEQRLNPGVKLIISGTPKIYQGRVEIIHPEIDWNVSDSVNVGRIIPVYTEIEGLSNRLLRKILHEATLRYADLLTEELPSSVLVRHGFPGLSEAVRTAHFPLENTSQEQAVAFTEFKSPSLQRLIYDEFFKFQFGILRQRMHVARQDALVIGNSGGLQAANDLEAKLPFQLTRDQKHTLGEILSDLKSSHPMNRLLQGDVGCGKTAVAFLTAGAVLAEGHQAVLMAPTEILAEQHFANARKLFNGLLQTVLLTGKTPAAERVEIARRFLSDEPLCLIGTHALLEDWVQPKNLALVLIDEQHRFGVEQRRILRSKGTRTENQKTIYPHTLILTATPIPRTLALTAYGDLSVSTIREMPPGRIPVKTHWIQPPQIMKVHDKIREELRAGRQAYFIYPLVDTSEAEGFENLKSATQEMEQLSRETFPDFRCGLLHGQLKSDEKLKVLDAFRKKEIHILVSTTVVEVGVDVPNATIMAIHHADRFGLSQLHQLRGRVGRGQQQSYCFLFTRGFLQENTFERMKVLERSHDGFEISEADLELRGPGEFLGTRQSGSLPFKLANLVRDRDWLLKSREDVMQLLKTDPDLKTMENAGFRHFVENEGKLNLERLRTS